MKLIKLVFTGLFFASGFSYGNQIFVGQTFQLEDSFTSVSFKQRAAIQSVLSRFLSKNQGCQVSGSVMIQSEGRFDEELVRGDGFISVKAKKDFSSELNPDQLTLLRETYRMIGLDAGDLRIAYNARAFKTALFKGFPRDQIDREVAIVQGDIEGVRKGIISFDQEIPERRIERGLYFIESSPMDKEGEAFDKDIKIKMFWTNDESNQLDIAKVAEEYGIQVYSKGFKGIGDINLVENILYGGDGKGELFVGETSDRDWVKFKQGSEEINLSEVVGVRLFKITGDIKDLDTTWQKAVSFENLIDGSIGIGEEIAATTNPYDSYPKLSQGSYFYVMEPIGGGGGGGGSLLKAVIRAAFDGHLDSGEVLRVGRVQKSVVPFSSNIQNDSPSALPVIQCNEPLSLNTDILKAYH